MKSYAHSLVIYDLSECEIQKLISIVICSLYLFVYPFLSFARTGVLTIRG